MSRPSASPASLPPPPPRRNWAGLPGWRWLQGALLVLAGAWAFAPAMHGNWLWDDRLDIQDNAELRAPGGLAEIWFQRPAFDYYPLKDSLQWLQWRWWQDRTLGYHTTNIGLHVLSAFLLWHLFRKLGVRWAWLGGLLFLVHPVTVESVAWIVELKNALSLPLLLLAMIAFLDYDQASTAADRGPAGRRAYLWALGWFLLSMLAKTSGVMFPVVILIHAWWKRGRVAWPDLKAAAGFAPICLALGAVTVSMQHRLGAEAIALGGLGARLVTAGVVATFYFCKCVVPVGLMPIYPRWRLEPVRWVECLPGLVWVAAAAWLGTQAAARFARGRAAPWAWQVLFALGFFLINLLPILGFIPVTHFEFTWAMDHLAYVPLIGIAGLAAAALGAVGARSRAAGSALAGALVLFLAISTHVQSRIFQDARSFWTYAVAKNPRAPLAQYNLGVSLGHSGNLLAAAAHYQAAIRLKPNYAEAYNNLAGVWRSIGRDEDALAQLKAALRLIPDDAEIHNNLGTALSVAGRTEEAIAEYQAAVRLKPDFARAHDNLGDALRIVGRGTAAIAEYREALRLDPEDAEAHSDLGAALVAAGQGPEAIREYQEALRLQPDFTIAHFNLGGVLADAGRLPEAMAEFRQALRLNRNFPEAQNSLGNALLKAGRGAEARACFEAALRLKPDSPEAHNGLGVALAGAGRRSEALAQFEAALRLRPNYPEARRNLEITIQQALFSPAGAP